VVSAITDDASNVSHLLPPVIITSTTVKRAMFPTMSDELYAKRERAATQRLRLFLFVRRPSETAHTLHFPSPILTAKPVDNSGFSWIGVDMRLACGGAGRHRWTEKNKKCRRGDTARFVLGRSWPSFPWLVERARIRLRLWLFAVRCRRSCQHSCQHSIRSLFAISAGHGKKLWLCFRQDAQATIFFVAYRRFRGQLGASSKVQMGVVCRHTRMVCFMVK
jgi:hypothetical protein